MNSENIRQLLAKINEMKNLFMMQQTVIPFLEDLFSFLEEIIPLSEELSNSLAESTSKVPFATRQLNNVTQATEMATTEILTLLEEMMSKIENMNEMIQQRDKTLQGYLKLEDRLTSLLKKAIGRDNTEFWEAFKRIQKEKKQVLEGFVQENATFIDTLNGLNEQANNIMLALQVQDITAQQIASVNHVLISIKERLENLLSHFSGNQQQTDAVQFDNSTTFDPDARFDTSGEKQKLADEVIQSVLSGNGNDNPAENDAPVSASDIDALFARNADEKGNGHPGEKTGGKE